MLACAGAPDGVEAAATAVRSIALEDFVLDMSISGASLHQDRCIQDQCPGPRRPGYRKSHHPERFSGARACVHFNDFGITLTANSN